MEKRLLNLPETANYLGITTSTLYSWVSERKISYIKIGRLVKFDLEMINKWIEEHTVEEYGK